MRLGTSQDTSFQLLSTGKLGQDRDVIPPPVLPPPTPPPPPYVTPPPPPPDNGYDIDWLDLVDSVCTGADYYDYICSTDTGKYRRIDGACNNMNNPQWGSAHIPMRRY